MIELNEKDIKIFDMQSSKGNQLKWENDQHWYKADYIGYEGLSEYVVSELLKYSSLKDNEYVLYKTEQIKYRNQMFKGCVSQNFLEQGVRLITLERLFQLNGIQLYQTLYKFDNLVDRVSYLVNETIKFTGLKDFGKYMTKMMAMDALFLNEDRHMHNIAVLVNQNDEYMLCPYFDYGASLLSDITIDYPMDGDLIEYISHSKSKTVCSNFYEQLEVFENLYGVQISFNFDKNVIKKILENDINYSDEIKQRVFDILMIQISKYQYLFK